MHPRHPVLPAAALLTPVVLACLGAASCSSGPTQISMDFTGDSGFFGSPFPSETRRIDAGTTTQIDLGGFPNPTGNAAASELLALAGQSNGFGVSSAVFFQTSGAIDATSLPTLAGSVDAGAPIFLINVDPASPDFLRRMPVQVGFLADAGSYNPPNLLSLLPLQGIPLDPLTTYAAVVLTTAEGHGKPLLVAPQMTQLATGTPPAGMPPAAFAVYTQALAALGDAGLPSSSIAAMAAFTTWDPTAGMAPYRTSILALPRPTPTAPFALTETFDAYCVYETQISMPDYQAGIPPYGDAGGGWAVDDGGEPAVQIHQTANFVVTVPRAPMPDGGFPLVVFCQTGAGATGTTPLVDRGTQAVNGGPPIVPGSGPAEFFAMAGWAGTSIDGPLDGIRNPTDGGDEDYLIFNVVNPLALRDNIRESALELQLTAHIMDGIAIDASGCPGVVTPDGGPVIFNPGEQALMGHSMGGTISPLALAFEPRFRAGILSGEGGSFLENILYKESPEPLLPGASLELDDFSLGAFDPILSILQWAGEPADPPAYAAEIIRRPQGGPARNILMFQGIVDTYILPPIANASSLSLWLDEAQPFYDSTTPALSQYTPLQPLLPFSGGQVLSLPASGNRVAGDGTTVTAFLVQHLQDAVEDGHEVVFQTDPPKYQYKCLLQSLLTGVPEIPADGAATDPCP